MYVVSKLAGVEKATFEYHIADGREHGGHTGVCLVCLPRCTFKKASTLAL